MTDEELQAIEARANAATLGPWAASEFIGHTGGCVLARIDDEGDTARIAETRWRWSALGMWQHKANLEFIASARQDIPALVAEVRQLRAALAAVKGAQP